MEHQGCLFLKLVCFLLTIQGKAKDRRARKSILYMDKNRCYLTQEIKQSVSGKCQKIPFLYIQFIFVKQSHNIEQNQSGSPNPKVNFRVILFTCERPHQVKLFNQQFFMCDNHLSPEKINKYLQLFSHFDYYHLGTIHYLHLVEILNSMHIKIKEEQVLSLLEETGNLDSTSIRLDEYLSIIATVIDDKTMNEQIRETFKLFDVDKSQMIDEEDIKKGFNELGMGFTKKDVRELLTAVGNNSIDYETFHEFILNRF